MKPRVIGLGFRARPCGGSEPAPTKTCPRCGTKGAEFGKNKAKKDGLQNYCLACRAADRANENKDEIKKYHKKYNAKNKDAISLKGKIRYLKNAPDIKERVRARSKEFPERLREENRRDRARHPIRVALASMKNNAKNRDITFTLTYAQLAKIRETTHCPVCGVEMVERGAPKELRAISKSVDRLDSFGPYSEDNCVCICYRCNWIKGFATWQELAAVALWLEEKTRGK